MSFVLVGVVVKYYGYGVVFVVLIGIVLLVLVVWGVLVEWCDYVFGGWLVVVVK